MNYYSAMNLYKSALIIHYTLRKKGPNSEWGTEGYFFQRLFHLMKLLKGRLYRSNILIECI